MKKTQRLNAITGMDIVFMFVIFLILLALGLSGCSKESLSRVQSQPKIEFVMNGSLKQYNQVSGGAVTVTGGRMYSFVGIKEPTAENYFSLSFKTDSLRPGTYSVGNTGVVTFREGTYIATNNNTSFSVTITSNQSGTVNGTFTGNLVCSGSPCSVNEGKLESISIVYY